MKAVETNFGAAAAKFNAGLASLATLVASVAGRNGEWGGSGEG